MIHLFLVFGLLSLSHIVTAQIPDCATGCIANAVKNATTCGSGDLACQCTSSNFALIEAAATTCVLNDCGNDAIQVLSAVNAECQAALSSSFTSNAIAAATSAAPSVSATESSGYDGLETMTATELPSTVTGTIVECGCDDVSTTYPSIVPSAAPSPTLLRNGSVTGAAPSVAYTLTAGASKPFVVFGNILAVGILMLVTI